MKEIISPEEKKKKERDKRLYNTYGLLPGEWEELSKNGCWICHRTGGRLNVDHRHVSKYKELAPAERRQEVRGCLCFLCNTMLHGVEKRKNARFFLERMAAYFQVFKIKGDF